MPRTSDPTTAKRLLAKLNPAVPTQAYLSSRVVGHLLGDRTYDRSGVPTVQKGLFDGPLEGQ